MSGFDLVPLAGGAPVRLPPGQTVLGRGPLLGITDKRVSRHHGLLENLSGQLRLKATHLNPCFIQSSLADGSPRPLNKDSWYDLHHGDLFSLLPGQLVFRVVAVGDDTPRNSQIFDEEKEPLPGSPEPDVGLDHPSRPDPGPTLLKATPAALSSEDHRCSSRSSKQEAPPTEVEDDGRDVTPSVTKKRVLPAWMMAAAPCSLKVRSAVKVKAASTGIKPAAASQATPTTMSSPEEAGLSEEEEKRPRKRRRKISDEDEDEAAQSKTDVPSEDPDQGPVGSGSEEASTAGKTMTRTSSKSKKNGERSPEGGVGSNGGSVSVPAPSKTGLRTPCPYGKDCYRKNPVHFQECSHPGDSDYEEEEEEEEDRPECPYGTDCYRKNPLHRKQFRHTKRRARATRGVPKRSQEDEDEDSFINDDSGDGGDDSDYVPPDSEDSGKEDVQTLQEESKTFLKRRR